jgi:DNA-binding NarL/FixJ family response regulator
MTENHKMLRILIADDSDLIRRGIRNLLSEQPDWVICGECSDGEDAVKLVEELRPDVLLLDLSIPGMHGRDVIRHCKKKVCRFK